MDLQTFVFGYPSLRLLRRALNTRGEVVSITGASSGIGEALAKAYAARGAKLVLSARVVVMSSRVLRTHVHLPSAWCCR